MTNACCGLRECAARSNLLTEEIFEEYKVQEIKLRDEYITLGQLLKAAGLVESGVEAKEVIQSGEAKVDGEIDTRRGRKLRGGEIVSFRGTEIKVVC